MLVVVGGSRNRGLGGWGGLTAKSVLEVVSAKKRGDRCTQYSGLPSPPQKGLPSAQQKGELPTRQMAEVGSNPKEG